MDQFYLLKMPNTKNDVNDFKREHHISKKLGPHPHILKIIEHNQEGKIYSVSKLPKGKNLRSFLTKMKQNNIKGDEIWTRYFFR